MQEHNLVQRGSPRFVTSTMVRIILESPSAQQLADWAAAYLAEHGWSVSRAQPPPETPQQLAERLGLTRRHILRRLNHPGCPPVQRIRSRGERVSLIVATPELDEFLKRKLRTRSQ